MIDMPSASATRCRVMRLLECWNESDDVVVLVSMWCELKQHDLFVSIRLESSMSYFQASDE